MIDYKKEQKKISNEDDGIERKDDIKHKIVVVIFANAGI